MDPPVTNDEFETATSQVKKVLYFISYGHLYPLYLIKEWKCV